MFKDLFLISLNNLKRRRLRSWLTMIGIFIGIASVVALISLGQGLQVAVTGQLGSIDADSLTIQNAGSGLGPPGSTVVEKLNSHDLNLIKRVTGVKRAIPVLLRMTELEYNQVINYAMISTVPEEPEDYERYYRVQNLKVVDGRLLKKGDVRKIVVGNNYADKDKFDKKVFVGKEILIEGIEFEVIGILEGSGNPFMNDVILMFYDELGAILDIEDEIDMIGVVLESSDISEETAEKIEKVLRKDRDLDVGEEDFSVETPSQALDAVNNILTAVNVIVISIAMISLIIGGIGIANTMYTSVLERQKEIGTMKAIGAMNVHILALFLFESGLLGLVGGIMGVLIGTGASLGISNLANSYFGSKIIEVSISIPLIIFVINFSFLIGIFSGLVPSIKASKLKPVEALRR